MGIDPEDLEGEAEAAYRAAGLDIADSVEPIWLARQLLGGDAVVGVHSLMQPGGGCLVRVHGKPRIYFRSRLPQQRRDFVIAHELAHHLLGERAGDEHETETACDALGAMLIAPRRAFQEALRWYGERFPALAEHFASTESLVALRFGEVTRVPLALVAPRSVRVRGERCEWPNEATLRSKSLQLKPTLRKATLRDDPKRFALRVR
jgi:hypothetical protein